MLKLTGDSATPPSHFDPAGLGPDRLSFGPDALTLGPKSKNSAQIDGMELFQPELVRSDERDRTPLGFRADYERLAAPADDA